MNRVLLLDRDGVLNVDLPKSVRRVDEVRAIPGAGNALRLLREAGYLIIVLTNQACVGRGDTSLEELAKINHRLEALLAKEGGGIDDWFICTHTSADLCQCRKPLPGLLYQAQEKYGFDMAQTWFVGDAERDVQAAVAAGARPCLVATGKGVKSHLELPDVPFYDDLLGFYRGLVSDVER